jgi:S1-C subfamily serine protease
MSVERGEGRKEVAVFQRVFAFGLLGVLPVFGATSLTDEGKPRKAAALGAQTRVPTYEEAKAYGLTTLVGCRNGQYVKTVDKGGSAEKAGLKEGDIILALDKNRLFSRDDLADFLRVSKPGSKVEVLVKRAGTFKEETVFLTFDAGAELSDKSVAWQYAGPGQLDVALAAAKKEKKLVLLGLSGADT